MPGNVSLFHKHALLLSDYAILRYILHSFALCRCRKDVGGDMVQFSPPTKYAPGCACPNGPSILATA